MPTDLKSYKIFIASPGGLGNERSTFKETIDLFNNTEGYERGMIFRPVGWEDTLAGVGRPQAIINKEIKKCDYFLLVLHDRWGSNPGGDSSYTSGTQEEFYVALEALSDPHVPMKQIILLFKDVQPAQLADPGPQLSQVLAFRKEREEKKDFLYTTFDNKTKLTNIILHHLSRWHREPEEKTNGRSGNRPSIGTSITTNFKVDDIEWLQSDKIFDNWDAAIAHANELYAQGKILQADFIYSQVFRSSNDPNHAVEYGKFLRKRYKLNHAEHILLKSIEMAESLSDKRCLAYATRQLGRVYEFQGNLARALAEFQKAYALYDSIGNLEGVARTNMDIGFALNKTNGPEKAISHLNNAYEMFKHIDHRRGMGECLSYLGLVYKDMGDFNRSEACHLQALDHLTSAATMDYEQIAATKSNLGVVKRLKYEYPESLLYHNYALQFYLKGSDLRAQSREYSNLGVVYRRTKQYDLAILNHERALELEDETLNEKGKAIQLSNLGLIYLETNDFEKAESYLKKGLKISIALSDVRGQSILFKHFAKLAIGRQEYDTAESFIQKGLKVDNDGNNRYGEAESLRLLGDIYRLRNDASYKEYYNSALTIYRSLELKHQALELEALLKSIDDESVPASST